MNKVKKKFYDLEKMQKEISDKLDKYEYNFNKEQKKANDINDFTINNNNNNFESCAKIDKNYQKVLDKRLDEIMGKINDNIINQNYLDFYEFLLQGRPKYTNKYSHNKNQNEKKEKNNSKISNDSFNKKEADEKNIKRNNNINNNNKKDNKKDNLNNNNNSINNSINNNDNINDDNNFIKNNNLINIDNNTRYEQKNDSNDINNKNNINIINNNNVSDQIRLNNFPQKANIHISYNGTGKINLEDIQNQQNTELLHKQQNIFLSNELTLLKCKLNKIRKENEYLQSLMHEKGMVKNTNVLEKFIGGFVEKLSLNWNDIVEDIIDEMIVDEIHELNEIELNKVNYEKNKNILINNLFNDELNGIIQKKSEEENTNIDLLIGNVEQIKKILNSVKESENNIKAKYNF